MLHLLNFTASPEEEVYQWSSEVHQLSRPFVLLNIAYLI